MYRQVEQTGCILNFTLTTSASPAKGIGNTQNLAGGKSVDLVISTPHGYDEVGTICYSFVVDATVVPGDIDPTYTVACTIQN